MTTMSGAQRERKQRYLRGLRGEKRGVSPVVATLILILIAVAAAAALYLWLVAWQGNITGGIGQPSAQYTVTIGGSTSMQPFDQLAVNWFEQNNSDVAISNNGGGSGAGMLAVCQGNVNIGATTTPETASLLVADDSCPSTPGITVTPIAYDAVDVVVASANTHGLLGINWDTLTAIYDHGSQATAPLLNAVSIDGASLAAAPFLGVAPFDEYATPAAYTSLAWDQIPATVQTYVFAIGGLHETAAPTTNPATVTEGVSAGGVAAAGVPCGVSVSALNDVCDTAVFGGAASGTPCGFLVCAGGGAAIVPVERSDASGATLTLEAKLFGAVSATHFATSFSGLGYSGCGSNNILADCGITVATAEQGDEGVLNAVAANVNAIGYAGDGDARTNAGIGTAGIVPFDAVGQAGALPQVSGTNYAYGAVVPTTGSTGTVAAGITGSTTANNYAGWRPFEFVTLQPPTGEVQRFIEFITDPANNAALALATGEVGLYSI
jgi:flagellin-like protein